MAYIDKKTYTAGSLWREFVFKRKTQFVIGSIAVFACNLMQVLIPRLIGYQMDFLQGLKIPAFFKEIQHFSTFKILFTVFLLANVGLFLSRMGWRYLLGRPTHRAGAWLRQKIWESVRFFPQEQLNKKYSTGTLMNASTSDVNLGKFLFGFTLIGLFDTLFLTVITLFMMWTINKELMFWTLILFPLLPPIVKKLSALEIDRYRDSQDRLSELDDQCAQAVATVRLQRLTQTGDLWVKRLLNSANEFREKRLSALFTGLRFFPVMGIGAITAYVILFIVGVKNVLAGVMSIGDFVAMSSYVLLLQDPLLELGFIISEMQRGRTSLERLCDIYNQPSEQSLIRPGEKVIPSKEVFKIKDLSFAFKNDKGKSLQVIQKLNFTLNQGQRLGLIGPIGAGKSTLVDILAGLREGYEGNVHLYGKEVGRYAHEELRNHIAIVSQKTFLFASSIRENIAIDKNLSDEEVWHYLSLAGLKEDVENFTDGIKTQLGEWGINLSGGQKQRLTLARALAAQPQLLMLDDCLSAVDTVTEEKILTNLDSELKAQTLIWVAHRESTLKYCDKILELGS